MSISPFSYENFPIDLIPEIAKYYAEDLRHLCETSKFFNKHVCENNQFWIRLILRDFPKYYPYHIDPNLDKKLKPLSAKMLKDISSAITGGRNFMMYFDRMIRRQDRPLIYSAKFIPPQYISYLCLKSPYINKQICDNLSIGYNQFNVILI